MSYQELEMYDGTIIRLDALQLKVVVQDSSTLPNKVSLKAQNRYYNPDL
jgi:hypothetical protein